MATTALILLALLPQSDRSALELAPGTTVEGGGVRFVSIESPDRSPVLPNGPVWEAHEDGDLLVSGPSGDPFVLHFATGEHRPPAGERLDPRLVELLGAPIRDGRPADEVYGFVMLNVRYDLEVRAALEASGARVLGTFPRNCVRVALDRTRVDAVLALPSVRWVGRARAAQVVQGALENALERAGESAAVDAYIDLFESDLAPGAPPRELPGVDVLGPGGITSAEEPVRRRAPRRSLGWQERRLTSLGIHLEGYDDRIQAFRARVTRADVEALVELDFVQFLEARRAPSLHHGKSQPLTNADFARATWDGGTSGNVVAGVADSGMRFDHLDFAGVLGVGVNLSVTPGPAFEDTNGHGSHVTGTILGRGNARGGLAGAAPGLASTASTRLINVRIFGDAAIAYGVHLADVFAFLAQPHTALGVTTPVAHVVNHSWGTSVHWADPDPVGSEAEARLIDDQLFVHRQLSVFSAGNNGPSDGSLTIESSAKNAFVVGNGSTWPDGSESSGLIAPSSSRGPTGDGRWKPNITAPGTDVWSASYTAPDAYEEKTGTSMAAPHVTGIVAQLMDRHALLRDRPEAVAALLMATAKPREGDVHGSYATSAGHHSTHGAGAIDASRAHGGSAQNALGFWGFELDGSSHVEIDVNVDPGATRMTVATFFSDLAAGAGAGQALLRDVDLYIDRAPFSAAGNSGDFTAHQSDVDNVEIRTLNFPASGAYRFKVWPDYGPTIFPTRVGVAVIISYGDQTPAGEVTFTADDSYLRPHERTWIRGAVTNTSDTAVAVHAALSPAGGVVYDAEAELLDGRTVDLTFGSPDRTQAALGNIQHGQTRRARWETTWLQEGSHVMELDVASETMDAHSETLQIIVDGTPPAPVPGLNSSTHQVGDRTCRTDISVDWSVPNDNLSGIAGYSHEWSTSPTTEPTGQATSLSGTTHTTFLPPATYPLGWWFHVRAIDRCGNAGPVAHLGPFFIGESTVTVGCTSNAHSASASGARIGVVGEPCLGDGSLRLRTIDMPPNQFGFYLASHATDLVPLFGGGQGNLCLAQPITRILASLDSTGASGSLGHDLDFGALPPGLAIDPGDTVHFQAWFRDMNPGVTSNTSDRVSVAFD